MIPTYTDNVYVRCSGKQKTFYRKYKGQELKLGRIIRYGWNTFGRNYSWVNLSKHNSV